MNQVDSILEKMLIDYSSGDHYQKLLEAKNLYIEITGKLNDDDDEYESRMNLFNDWYLFTHRESNGKRLVDDYIANHDLEPELAKAILNINYSLFQFKKKNLKQEIVLEDILHNEKVVLSKENGPLAVLKDDLFVGRVIMFEGKGYFLKGVCTLPQSVLSILKKESKKMRKLNNILEEEKFLLKIENLKVRSKNYGHLDASRIFVF